MTPRLIRIVKIMYGLNRFMLMNQLGRGYSKRGGYHRGTDYGLPERPQGAKWDHVVGMFKLKNPPPTFFAFQTFSTENLRTTTT